MFFAYIDPGTGWTIFNLWGILLSFLLACIGLCGVFFKKIFRFLRKHTKPVIIILTLTIICCAAVMVIMNNNKENAFDKKVIILGMDGLSPDIMEPMMAEGKLPNFSRLKEEGSYRHLSTTNPPQSPVAWTGFATGKNPGKTGLFDFIVRDPETYRLDLSLSTFEKGMVRHPVQTERLWQYTSRKKIPTVIINCPVTFPPDKIYGRMLSGMGVPDILGTEGTFTFYTSEPLETGKDIGGNVFHIEKSPEMVLNLIGPRVAGFKKPAGNAKVPLNVILHDNKNTITVKYQNREAELKAGQWSGWQEVSFKVGSLKIMKGIFKFYLIETNPEFKLYITPIHFDPREPYYPVSSPADYSRELSEKMGLYSTLGMIDTWALSEGRIMEDVFLEQVEADFKEKEQILNYELGRFNKGVYFQYFEVADIIQHIFWRYKDSSHPLYEKDAPEVYKHMIESWYQRMDGILGKVMKVVEQGDVLIVLSDHGFATFKRVVHLNSWLKENGYLTLKNPDAKAGAELLCDVDWSKTRAYAIGFGAVYINLKGREKEGIVNPKEAELLKEEIFRKLKTWSDEKYKSKVVNEVYKREDIFRGDYAEKSPDLYVGFNIGYRASWQTALGAVPEKLIEDNLKKWSGDHLFDPQIVPGVLFSNKKITKDRPSIYDITPTILEITGWKKEEINNLSLDGNSLF